METSYTKRELAGFIDHTLLKADASEEQLATLCHEAAEYGFASVMVLPAAISFCAGQLSGSQIPIGTVVGFPLGQNTLETKCFETQNALELGAGEIDYVINITPLKAGRLNVVEEEMRRITALCRQQGALCKVIFENCYLTKEEITALCHIARQVKPDFVKTSTGFGPSGALPEDVALMKRKAGPEVAVKAAGGIRTLAEMLAMLDAGATRIGASAGVSILNELP